MPEKAKTHIPEGLHSITTYLWFNGNCLEAIDFYQKAMGFEPGYPPMMMDDGKTVMHSMLKLGGSSIMMADVMEGDLEKGPEEYSTAGLYVYVEDCDEIFSRAVKAGCEVIYPLEDAFWGDRFGKVKDPYGHCWAIATHKWELTPGEMDEAQKEAMKKM